MTCPNCGSVSRQLVRAWEDLPGVWCGICATHYALPRWGVMTAILDVDGGTLQLSPVKAWEPIPGYVVAVRRSFWRRLRDAWRGWLAGWRGGP